MKITYIHQHFALPSDGGGSRPYEFARRMAADGHEVTMICGGTESLDRVVQGIHVRRLAIPYGNSMSVPERLLSFARFMVSASISAARTKADVIFVSSTPLTVAVPGIIAKLVQRVPMVFEVRDLWPSVPIELGYLKNPIAIRLARVLEKMAYRSASSIVALSPGMRDGVLSVNPASSVTVIPNACDFELFGHNKSQRNSFREREFWDDNEVVVVYAGGFGPLYEIDWSVRLAATLNESNIRFVLIGEGASTPAMRELATNLGLDVKRLFPGKLPRDKVAEYYSGADIILSTVRPSPGLDAASINKVFDGMAAGKPVVFNHGGWLCEMMTENGSGWKLDRDIETAARQLRQIVADHASLESAGITSAELGRTHFDRNRLYEDLMQVLENTTEMNQND